MKHLGKATFSLHGIDIVMERLELICIFLVILSWTSVDAGDHYRLSVHVLNQGIGCKKYKCRTIIILITYWSNSSK